MITFSFLLLATSVPWIGLLFWPGLSLNLICLFISDGFIFRCSAVYSVKPEYSLVGMTWHFSLLTVPSVCKCHTPHCFLLSLFLSTLSCLSELLTGSPWCCFTEQLPWWSSLEIFHFSLKKKKKRTFAPTFLFLIPPPSPRPFPPEMLLGYNYCYILHKQIPYH